MAGLHEETGILIRLRPAAATALAFGLGLDSLSREPVYPRINALVISIPTMTAFYNYNDFSLDENVNEILARTLLIWLAHMSYLLCLLPAQELQRDRENFAIYTEQKLEKASEDEAIDRTSHKAFPKSTRQPRNWRYACKRLFSRKAIGEPWPIASKPNYGKLEIAKENLQEPMVNRGSKGTSHSKRSFIIHRCGILLCRYLILCVYYDQSVYRNTGDGKPWSPPDFTPEKQIFLRRLICPSPIGFLQYCNIPLSSRDFSIRFWLGLDVVVSDYLTLSSLHELLAIIAVGINLDAPEEWPQLFGSITEAYTVRNFWSRFWHRLVYRSFRAHASIISRYILGIRKRSAPARYLNNALVFLLSGLMHTIVERTHSGPGTECTCWGVTVWFCMQVGAILAEEVVQRVWAKAEEQLPLKNGQGKMLQKIKRGVGYLWVVIWICWSRSKTYYPKAYCMMEDH